MLGGVPFASATGVEHDRLLQTERVVPISKDMRDTAPPRLTTIEQHSAFRDTLPHTAPDRFGTPRVLCVDDDPNLLQGLYRILGFDFDVVTDADAGAALRRLEVDSDFQVVLSDLRMPGIDGTRFLAETRRIVQDIKSNVDDRITKMLDTQVSAEQQRQASAKSISVQ